MSRNKKNCIVQYFIDTKLYTEPEYNDLSNKQDVFAQVSAKSFQSYAERYNCDYKLIDKPKLNHKHPTFERFDLWLDDSWWDTYDQIMYVDSDVFAMPGALNIFDQSNDDTSLKAAWSNKWQGDHKTSHYENMRHGLLKEFSIEVMKAKGFQPGVFVLNKHVVQKMKPFIEKFREFDEDDGVILMYATMASGVNVEHLDHKFNHKRAYFMDAPPVYFFHAAGHKKINYRSRIIHFLQKNGIWNK